MMFIYNSFVLSLTNYSSTNYFNEKAYLCQYANNKYLVNDQLYV